MDVEKALKLGEIAKELKALQLALALAKAGQECRAWITAIRATDEGECERSIDLAVPPYKEMVSPGSEALRQAFIDESAPIFALIEKTISAKIGKKEAEMEVL